MNTVHVPALLFHLQQVDMDLDRVTAEQQSLSQALQGDTRLRRVRSEYAVAQQQQQASMQEQKDAEWTLENIQRRLAAHEQRLYGGTNVNAKDLDSLQQEVQRLRAQHHRQEEAVLEAMDATENATEATQRKQKALQQAEQEWQREYALLIQKRDQLETRRQEILAKRSHLSADIAEDLLKRYEAMRRSKQGRAVSKVEQGSCQWCRVVLTPSELQHVRTNTTELQTCSNCGRILYYER